MGWKPKELSSYSLDDISKIEQNSPAFARYRQILKKHPSSFSDQLRYSRLQSWSELVADIFTQASPAQNICSYWSKTADKLIQSAWNEYDLNKSPLACFALGKLGSQELNLSSDIDLIIISQNPCPQETEIRVRNFTKCLSDISDFGFGFRVDYDLRPGGRFSPIIPSLSRAEDHYWTQGRTWERLALVRARPICGVKDVIDSAQDIFNSFTYRKYINYSLFEDLKNLRSDIFQFRPKAKADEINLKLMDGGIRDIELFVHALQVIHGGRVPAVRVKGTGEAIEALINNQCGDKDDLNFLRELYWTLRHEENRSQAIEDSQTHSLKRSLNSMVFDKICSNSQTAANIVSDILGTVEQNASLPHGEEKQLQWLDELGFNEESRTSVWPSLINLTARSSRAAHDEEARQRVLKLFIERLANGNDPNLGLLYLCDFIKSVRAKSSFFSLLLHEQKLVDDLANLFSTSPALSQIFVNRPELLDSFVFNLSESLGEDTAEVLEELFEKKLLAEVRYSMDFLRNLKVNELIGSLSDLADLIFSELLKLLKQEIPSNVQVLKMGKWAGKELGLRSDLDMVLITPDKVSESDYKIARRLVSRVTENHKGGHFYQIDLRLRPSGSAGPLILSESQLLDYLQDKAEPWETQSYLRSRFDGPLNDSIRDIVLEKKFTKTQLEQLKDIRLKLYKNSNDRLDIKYQPGGLLDIEFSSQIAAIQSSVRFKTPSTTNILTALGEDDLAQSYTKLRKLEQVLQLLTERGSSTLEKNSLDTQRVSRVMESTAEQLYSTLAEILRRNTQRLKALDPIWSSD